MKNKNKYISDISRKQFETIRADLESARKKTRPREVDLYEIFCGVLYVLKSGCQWRMIPNDLPKWRTIYFYYQIWSEKKDGKESLLEEILKKISWRGPTRTWQELQNNILYN